MPTTTPTPPLRPETDAPPLPWVNQPEFVLTDGPTKDQTLGLVYLSELVKWLMKSKSLHFVPAVLALHKELTDRNDVVLYVANKTGTAHVVGLSDAFDPYANERVRRRVYSPGVRIGEYGECYSASSRNSATVLPPVPTGQAAALDYVLKVWGDGRNPESIIDRADLEATKLAMTCNDLLPSGGDLGWRCECCCGGRYRVLEATANSASSGRNHSQRFAQKGKGCGLDRGPKNSIGV